MAISTHKLRNSLDDKFIQKKQEQTSLEIAVQTKPQLNKQGDNFGVTNLQPLLRGSRCAEVVLC